MCCCLEWLFTQSKKSSTPAMQQTSHTPRMSIREEREQVAAAEKAPSIYLSILTEPPSSADSDSSTDPNAECLPTPSPSNTLLSKDSLEQEEQKQFLESHAPFLQHLSLAFQQVMALPVLVTLFGDAATQNAMMPFSEHFKQRTLKVINTLPAATNPYLSQLLTGQFTDNTVYPWFRLAKQATDTEMEYCLSSMAEALLKTHEKYDFIHLSNILDWLTKAQASELLDLASKRLKKDGWLIIRQLNSNLEIQKLYTGLHWETALSQALHKEDKSFFYQQLHIARML